MRYMYTHVNVSGHQYVHCRNQLHEIVEQMEQLKFCFQNVYQIGEELLIS